MRAVMIKELRELLVVAVPLWVVAGIVAASEIAGPWNNTEEMVIAAIVGGLAVGLTQGLLDQFRRDDAFLKHRPLSANRLQMARTFAGLLVLAIACVVFFTSLWIATLLDLAQAARITARLGEDFALRHTPMTYGLATHGLVVALSVASWAVARFVAGLRPLALIVPMSLVVPAAAWAVLSRLPTIPCAAQLAALLGLLLLSLVHVRETGRRGPLQRVLLLGLLCLVFLEGALWARSGLAEVLQDLYPSVGLTEKGTIRRWDWSWPDSVVEYDDEGNVMRRWPRIGHGRSPSQALLVHGSLHGEDDSYAYEQMDDARFIPSHRRFEPGGKRWGDSVAQDLNAEQSRRRREVKATDWSRTPRWRFEDGRIVCRLGNSDEVVAWIGPEGSQEGAPSTSSPRFPEDLAMVAYAATTSSGRPPGGPWTFTAQGGEDSWFLRLVPLPADDPYAPLRVEVMRRPFEPYEGPLSGPPAVIPDGRRYWLVDSQHGLLAPRLLAEDEYAPRQRYGTRRTMTPGGFETWLRPVHPTRYGLRLRYFQGDGTEVVGEVRLAPTRITEKIPAVGLGILGALRPPLLNAWALLSSGPSTRSELNRWWWRDPFFSAGSYVGWFLVSLLIGALMAVLAWRSARLRLPTRAAQLRWVLAAFLLGPLGLLWMKLTIGRTAVLPVGEGRRAVNLDATPDNRTPWPQPDMRGTEIFARG